MKHVTLHITDSKYPLFIELAKSLDFVKKIEEETPDSKESIKKDIQQSVKELNLIKKGKLKAKDARELAKEL